MPLSEHEQRILDEIERRLAAEDPKFARSATLVTPRGVAVKRIKRAVFGFVAGLTLLLIGLLEGIDNTNIFVGLGVAGFTVMLFAVIAIAKASKSVGRPAPRSREDSWFNRAEQRWKKRFERGEDR